MRRKDLPEIIFFEERVGSNGIHCLDYKNSWNIAYIRDDVKNSLHDKVQELLLFANEDGVIVNGFMVADIVKELRALADKKKYR